MEPDEDIVNSCRVCGNCNQGVCERLVTDDEQLTAAGVLYEQTLGLEIELDTLAHYPHYICNSCFLQLKLFKALKEKATATLELLNTKYSRDLQNATETLAEQGAEIEQQIALDEQDLAVDDQDIAEDEQHLAEEEQHIAGEEQQLSEDEQQLSEEEQHIALDEHDLAEEEEHADVNLLVYEDASDSIKDAEDCIQRNEKEYDSLEGIEEVFEDEYVNDELQVNPEVEATTLAEVERVENSDELIELMFDEVSGEAESQGKTEDDASSAVRTDDEAYEEVDYLEETESLSSEAKPKKTQSSHCDSCGITFERRSDLTDHRRTVHNNRFECPKCDKSFVKGTALRTHMKLHLSQPQYQCPLCPKAFHQKVHFNYHMNGHNNVRPFKCKQCPKAFISKSDLSIHTRTHTNERRYNCEKCGKSFFMMQHLKMHMYSHIGKTLVCSICSTLFTSPSTLYNHMKSIHGENAFHACYICGRKFRRKHHLMIHYNNHKNKGELSEVTAEEFLQLADDDTDDVEEEYVVASMSGVETEESLDG